MFLVYGGVRHKQEKAIPQPIVRYAQALSSEVPKTEEQLELWVDAWEHIQNALTNIRVVEAERWIERTGTLEERASTLVTTSTELARLPIEMLEDCVVMN